jgi:hypothetical protein
MLFAAGGFLSSDSSVHIALRIHEGNVDPETPPPRLAIGGPEDTTVALRRAIA